MGTYSVYKIEATEETAEKWAPTTTLNAFQFQMLERISGYNYQNWVEERHWIKWYSYKEDMEELSRIFPTFFFRLERDKEDEEGIREYIFKNGETILSRII